MNKASLLNFRARGHFSAPAFDHYAPPDRVSAHPPPIPTAGPGYTREN